MIYLAMFAISLLFLYVGLSSKRVAIRRVAIVIGLLVPCVFAGLRGISVGTDTSGYVHGSYEAALTQPSIIQFFKESVGSKDVLYYTLTYGVAKSGISFQFLLFMFEALMVVPLFVALCISRKKKGDVLLGMVIFYLFAYNLSLNMVRQMIALSFVVLGFALVMNQEKKKMRVLGLLMFIVAIGFHTTALVSLPLYIIYRIFQSGKVPKNVKRVVGYITLFLGALAVIFYRQFFQLLSDTGIYPSAVKYIARFGGYNFNTMSMLVNVALILMLIFNRKKIQSWGKEEYWFGIYTSILNFILSIMGLFVANTQRIAYYMLFTVLFLYIPRLSIGKKNDKTNAVFACAGIVLFFLGYWVVMTLLTNRNDTLPYVLFYHEGV